MAIDTTMAWRNIWRNPRRTILTISAIVFASTLLIFMLSFQLGSYGAMINASVRIHTGHLQVQAKGYQDKKDMRLVVPDPSAVGKLMAGIPEVDAYTFRANAFSLASSRLGAPATIWTTRPPYVTRPFFSSSSTPAK